MNISPGAYPTSLSAWVTFDWIEFCLRAKLLRPWLSFHIPGVRLISRSFRRLGNYAN